MGVAAGQVWHDCDKRTNGVRFVKVLSVDETHATVVRATMGLHGFSADPVPATRIKLSRMKPGSTGYRLVQDVSNNQEARKMAEVDGGTKVILPTGGEVKVATKFTTAVRYVEAAAKGATVTGDGEESQAGRAIFQKADGSGRLYLGPDAAKAVVLEELRG